MAKKSIGRAYDMCNKSAKTRSKLYRKKAIKRQRSDMCPSGKMPRCVKGLSYCVKTPKRTGSRKKGSRILYLK